MAPAPSKLQNFGRGRGSGAVTGSDKNGSESAVLWRKPGGTAGLLSGAKPCTECGSASDFPACTVASTGAPDGSDPPPDTVATRRDAALSAAGALPAGCVAGANAATLDF